MDMDLRSSTRVAVTYPVRLSGDSMIGQWKAVLSIVIGFIKSIFGMGDAVFAISYHRLISIMGRMRG